MKEKNKHSVNTTLQKINKKNYTILKIKKKLKKFYQSFFLPQKINKTNLKKILTFENL